jgi:hypothetical protein
MKALHFRPWACAIFVASASTMGATQAQTIYRCGNNYSDIPCAQAVKVPTADLRTPAQKAQTDEATSRSASLAGQLEKTRRADEADAQQRAQALAATQAAKTAPKPQADKAPHKAKKGRKHKEAPGAAAEKVSKPSLSKPKKPDGFTVKVPAPAKPTKQNKP